MRIKNHSVLVAVVLVFGFAAFTSCNKDNPPKEDPTYSTLKEALNDISLFSNIKENPDTGSEFDYKEQYSMFFTQDLDHSDEGGDTFRQKVCILFRGFDHPTIMVTEGYYFWGFRDAGDLGINLNANMVHVEHRNTANPTTRTSAGGNTRPSPRHRPTSTPSIRPSSPFSRGNG